MLEVKWKDVREDLVNEEIRSFNPCYVGSKMESFSAMANAVDWTEFQSLLCWK